MLEVTEELGLGPDSEKTTIILVALNFPPLPPKSATQLYIQHEQLVSFALVNRHNMMNDTDRLGSECAYNEAGLTGKRPFS